MTRKKLVELGEKKLAKQLDRIYLAEIQKASADLTIAEGLFYEDKISETKYRRAAVRYYENFAEWYHFAND